MSGKTPPGEEPGDVSETVKDSAPARIPSRTESESVDMTEISKRSEGKQKIKYLKGEQMKSLNVRFKGINLENQEVGGWERK